MRKSNKGFTLVELLVVIAIIGILSSVVLVSLNSARTKARDARRMSDLHQLSLAAENYYDANANYPITLATLTPTYIASVPKDPSQTANSGNYFYAALGSGTTCSSYHIGAILENYNTSMASDSDAPSTDTVCTSGGTNFGGATTDCVSTAGAGTAERCYDVKP